MASRDQPFSDRASVFWGHHRLLVEQLAGIAGQDELGLERRDALVGSREFVGLHARDALNDSVVHRNKVAWQTPVSAATAANSPASVEPAAPGSVSSCPRSTGS